MKNEVETWLVGRDSKVTSPQAGPAGRENNVWPFWGPQAMGRPSGELTPVRIRSVQQNLTGHLP